MNQKSCTTKPPPSRLSPLNPPNSNENTAGPKVLSPSTKKVCFISKKTPRRPLNGDVVPSNDEIFFYSGERLKDDATKENNQVEEPIKNKQLSTSPNEGNKERSLDVPSQKLNARLKNKTRSSDSLSDNKKNPEDQENNANDKKNKFTWCGSCKTSSLSTTAKSKRNLSTSPLKKQSRSSLTTDSIALDNSNSKITLNLSKYSPCASRLANQASPKSLKTDLSPLGGTISPDSPLHQGRAVSPLSLNVQRLQRPTRSKSAGGGASPKSCSGDEGGGEEDSKRATAPASAIELSLDGARRGASGNCRSRR